MTFRIPYRIDNCSHRGSHGARAIFSIRHLALPFCALALAAAAQSAQAQALQPGLWETNNKMGGGKLQEAMAMAQQQLAAVDPEQRKRIEDMMARQVTQQVSRRTECRRRSRCPIRFAFAPCV